jgi:DNA polymerase I
MAQKSLDFYSQAQKKPVQAEAKAEAPPPIAIAESEKKEKKRRAFPPVAPENLPPSYFVSATYDGRSRKAVIKLYEPQSGRIYFWYDNTGHKPYCLTNLSQDQLEKIYRLIHHEGFDHC